MGNSTSPTPVRLILFCGLLILLGTGIYLQHAQAGYPVQGQPGLKDYYRSFFPIGVAVSPAVLQGAEGELVKREFNSITPENAMKMSTIHPQQARYNWKDADAIVDFAQANGIKVRGHNLCWHEQVPDWMFKNADGGQVSSGELLSRLHDHIFAVVSRYKGKIYAWDVVNEAIDDNPDRFMRNSRWYQICGEEFVAKAFEYAHEADPAALLFYNDYNTERPEKREKIYRLLKKLKAQHVPVNGIGLQGHWSLSEPSPALLQEAISRYASLGLDVQVTELDVSVFPWEKERRELRPGEATAFTPLMEQRQAQKYAEIFGILRQHRQQVTGVTFWNLSDQQSWLDDYPVKGRKNYPLLFDQYLQPKKAYHEVITF